MSSTEGAALEMPALAITQSSRPKVSTAWPMPSATAVSEATSTTRAIA